MVKLAHQLHFFILSRPAGETFSVRESTIDALNTVLAEYPPQQLAAADPKGKKKSATRSTPLTEDYPSQWVAYPEAWKTALSTFERTVTEILTIIPPISPQKARRWNRVVHAYQGRS